MVKYTVSPKGVLDCDQGLEQVLQRAITETEYDGITFFGKGEKQL